jgi:predicted MFS family arabinose efflux permease
VFAAELGFAMVTMAGGAYLAGYFLDAGVPASSVATDAGLLMLIPAALWLWAQRLWRVQPSRG